MTIIIAAIAGGVGLIAIIAGLLAFFLIRKRKNKSSNTMTMSNSTTHNDVELNTNYSYIQNSSQNNNNMTNYSNFHSQIGIFKKK